MHATLASAILRGLGHEETKTNSCAYGTFSPLETISSSTCLPPTSILNIFIKLTWNTRTQMFSLNNSLKVEDFFSFFFFKYWYHKKLKDSVTIQDYVKQQHRWCFPYKRIYTVLTENH